MLPELPRIIIALLIAALISVRGRRKKSLSKLGAAAAFTVGFLSFASSVRFGSALMAFYFSSTRATRYKADLKRQIEDGYKESTGNRSAKQVLASSLPGVLIAITYVLLYRYDGPVTPAFPLRSSLNLAYLLFFAACAGDTLASEIGIAMPGPGKQPILVLAPWRSVPRGTNGGITVEGTLASALGGFIVGSIYFLAGPEYSFSQLWLVVVGVLGGFLGSLFDSIIGMYAQASWYDSKSKKVLKEAPSQVDEKSMQLICGKNLLSGETVNAIAAILTAALAPALLSLFHVDYIEL